MWWAKKLFHLYQKGIENNPRNGYIITSFFVYGKKELGVLVLGIRLKSQLIY
jgi:hypothetical protein